MAVSDAIQVPVASPDGRSIAYVQSGNIFKRDLAQNGYLEKGRCRFSPATKFTSLKWSADSKQLLVAYDHGVHVIDSEVLEERVWLKNGTGGLGRVATADFIGTDYLLVISEFGKSKLWHMNSAKALDLPNVKTTCDGQAWGLRPGKASSGLFALLTRNGADDNLALHFPSLTSATAPIKLPTVDAQLLSWSPDGRWLAILDVPTASPNLHIYTPDGHLFRSYPTNKDADDGLSTKNMAWSADGRYLALSKHDGKVELLNTKTFSPLAILEHNTTIDQSSLPQSDQAPVWLEILSASNTHSYSLQSHPVLPPLSTAKPTSEPSDLGVAELSFSSDSNHLVTRDCRMLNTIWLWNMATLSAHAVVIQHANVRSLSWHPTRPDILLIDCAEGFAHVYDVSSVSPPLALPTGARPKAKLSWVNTTAEAKSMVMATEMHNFQLIYPEGQDEMVAGTPRATAITRDVPFEEGGSEDSLFEVLSGRKPLPPKTAPSFTEMVDLEAEAEEDTISGGPLEDTFREKKKKVDVDPLDDSDIF
ncbi:hypothetical protein CLAFUW4_02753 [Fulvia fulva]|uniref:Uncharacterized protein n=1 Tax=Passalora fulva TaxID=5499 RepID=A0A9Q8L969_PASFU|nr:uncharacterized protein CLAFUR5_02740 [Fulvia fulva]KAK4632318.1 hypothetical protein CLAFUR4_02748 [Fulvia fulva]KAK4633831.1 hypothetical protein CLAFUR0_02750 [Fulvia fulva]UJO13076.1 hypothetical protein CLAFUR5_02740 [Fulvia fulva]WPV11317.1 hypothetical protein CLAFUW4_02753 [Fulvia fulva]WPV26781.1 hypothetical protein CLAFUW7_02752 [Fulvia fulva]